MKGIDVARYIVDKCCRENHPITNLHLQKILYFVQGEYYRKTRKWLIDDDFLAWPYGPVLKEVYDQFQWYCSSGIREIYDTIQIPKEIQKIINPIITEKRMMTAGALVSATHQKGLAWNQCYNGNKNTIIPKEFIERDFI